MARDEQLLRERTVVAELRFSSDPRLMKVLRAVIQFFAQQVGFGDADATNLMLAADEACTNIIRHGYAGRSDESIYVRVESLSDRIDILFEDTGVPMPMEQLKPRPAPCEEGELKPGGLGTYLISCIMDRVSYTSEAGPGNRLHLVKYRSEEHRT